MPMSDIQIRVLQLTHQGKSMRDIAKDIERSLARVQQITTELEESGHISNPFGSGYSKEKKRTLTRKGRQVLIGEGLLEEEPL